MAVCGHPQKLRGLNYYDFYAGEYSEVFRVAESEFDNRIWNFQVPDPKNGWIFKKIAILRGFWDH